MRINPGKLALGKLLTTELQGEAATIVASGDGLERATLSKPSPQNHCDCSLERGRI
jgi:hypothetical protein